VDLQEPRLQREVEAALLTVTRAAKLKVITVSDDFHSLLSPQEAKRRWTNVMFEQGNFAHSFEFLRRRVPDLANPLMQAFHKFCARLKIQCRQVFSASFGFEIN
jgi:hypothetical protein